MAKPSENRKRLFLIDGSALAYRSYFAFIRNPLINSKGINTGGIYGFTNTLIKILKDEQPDAIACVFDTPAKTFRHEIFPEYKATREKMPDEMAEQFPVIREIVEAFHIPLLEKDGYEADDVIGTLALQAESQGMDVFMVTGDKDFMQLVTEHIRMYILGRGRSLAEIIGPDEVEEKLGIHPRQVIDYMGLMGDSSDNVPGVPGVGPKTALELIQKFGSMEKTLSQTDVITKAKIRENLEVYHDQALLSKDLVTIDTSVSLNLEWEDLKVEPPDSERVLVLFKELEFNSLISEVGSFLNSDLPDLEKKYHILRTRADFDSFLKELKKQTLFALDLETTSIDPLTAEIVGFSFSWKEGEAFYLPVRMPDAERQGDLFPSDPGRAGQEMINALKPVLENPKIHKCGQNIKYDWLVLRSHNVNLQGVDFDTMIAAYLINPTARRFNLDALALEYLNYSKIPTETLIGKGKKQIRMDEVNVDKVGDYACEDADVAFRLRRLFEPKLESCHMKGLFQEVEMPLVETLLEMEENGVALDTDLLATLSREMEEQLNLIQGEIFEIAGEEFNINSTQQLGKILFEKLKVHELVNNRRPKRTKTGYATDVRVLESLSMHPLPRKLLDYRQLMKLRSTYVDALPKLIHPKTGRVHASFNQTVTATGRLSTSNPNLQNIPIRTELGKEIRKAFVPEKKGWVLLSADYSQIELRIMAHLSGDETLMESFRLGEDVHRRTASEILNISPDAVTDDHRRQAKTINFGIMYGMGPYGLASRLGISNQEAENFITAYFARYPKINTFMSRTIGNAYKLGYVTTLMNRRRYLPELKSDNKNIRDFGERTAINTPIQGTAADLIKIAMIRISENLRRSSWKTRMILQIHDELLFEAPKEEAGQLSDMVRREMEEAIQLSVPVKVDVGVGENWFEAH